MIDPLSDSAFTDLSHQTISDEDKRLRVRFYYDEIADPKASEEMGRPIFKTVEMCSIKIPGENSEKVHRVDKKPELRLRFPTLYARFKAGEKEQVEGTLLREWGVLTRAVAKSYEAVDILTVEQLAGLSDATCQKYRGSVADRQKAKDWLDKAKGLEPVAQARAENAQLRAEVEALKEAIAAMGGKVSDEPKRRRKSTPEMES